MVRVKQDASRGFNLSPNLDCIMFFLWTIFLKYFIVQGSTPSFLFTWDLITQLNHWKWKTRH